MEDNLEYTGIWSKYGAKCPECKSMNIEKTNIHKQILKYINKGYKKVEITKYICRDCEHEWWKR